MVEDKLTEKRLEERAKKTFSKHTLLDIGHTGISIMTTKGMKKLSY